MLFTMYLNIVKRKLWYYLSPKHGISMKPVYYHSALVRLEIYILSDLNVFNLAIAANNRKRVGKWLIYMYW